jgi:TP901 family phage tail tape measure protein
MSLSKLSIDLQANIADFESDMGRAAQTTARQTQAMERQIAGYAKYAAAALGGAVVAGFIQATRAAQDFERSMAEVSTLLDDTSSMDGMTASVKELSKEYGKAPTEQASALYQIISSGAAAGAEAIDVLTASNQLAVGGVTDLKTAADGLTNVLNVYGTEAGTALDISDKFFVAMKAGKTTVGELAGSIGPVISVAKELGISFDELVAAGSTLTKGGISTSQSFNSLKAALANVIKPSKDAEEVAGQLGIQFNAAAVESMGLAGFLDMVKGAAGGNIETMSKLFGSVEGLNAVLALTGSGADTFAQMLEGLENAAGETEKAVAKMGETADQAFARLSAAIKVEMIEAGAAILEVLVPALQALVENLDLVINFIKALAAVIGGLYINKILLAATATGGLTTALGFLRAAFIAVGGPIFVVSAAIASIVTGYQRMQQILQSANADITKSTRLMIGLADAIDDVTSAQFRQLKQDLTTKYNELGKELEAARLQYVELHKQYNDSANLSGVNSQATQVLAAEIEALEMHVLNTRKVWEAYGKELAAANKRTGEAIEPVKVLGQRMKENAKFTAEAEAAANRLADDAYAELLQAVEELEQQQAAYNRTVQDFIDIGDPVGALVREFAEAVEEANLFLANGDITLQQYQNTLNTLSDGLGKAAAGMQETAQESDLMKERMLESVRILERSFQSMWQNIFEGGENIFSSLADGFKAMLADMVHKATTQKITVQLEALFNGQAVDYKQLSEGLAGLAGLVLGSKLGGGGEYANMGAGVGALLGSIAGPIGTAIGGVLGGVLGGLLDSDRPMVLEIAGFDISKESKSDSDAMLETIFGTSFFRSRRVDAAAIEQYKQTVKTFDQSIASFLDDAQIGKIADALKVWSNQIEGESLSIEQLLNSRLTAVIATFSETIRSFVNEAESLEERANRLQVAVNAENLMKDAPDLFGGRSLTQFLSVVEAFQNGTETIVDAFNEVLQLLVAVKAATDTLASFANSDPAAEFEAMLIAQGRTVAQQLIDSYSELGLALATSDNSVAALQNIASMVATVREGEIRYLTQLDALQKGLNANLDKLQAEILGLTALPKTGADMFNEARDLVQKVLNATSAEEISAIEQQFLGLIRAMSPEDQIAMQEGILQLIESFRRAATDMVGDLRADALDNATNVRDQAQDFLDRVGTPLEIIAATSERAAAALELIVGQQVPIGEGLNPPVDIGDDQAIVDSIIAANGIAADNQNRILEEGMRDLSRTMADGSSFTAAALASAIRNGDFRFTLVVKESDLVTR